MTNYNDDILDLTRYDNDYNNTVVEKRDFNIPYGTYQTVIEDLALGLTLGNKTRAKFTWKFKITEGTHSGKYIWKTSVIWDKKIDKNNIEEIWDKKIDKKKGYLYFIKQDFETCGIFDSLSTIKNNLRKFIGIRVKIKKSPSKKSDWPNIYIQQIIDGDVNSSVSNSNNSNNNYDNYPDF